MRDPSRTPSEHDRNAVRSPFSRVILPRSPALSHLSTFDLCRRSPVLLANGCTYAFLGRHGEVRGQLVRSAVLYLVTPSLLISLRAYSALVTSTIAQPATLGR